MLSRFIHWTYFIFTLVTASLVLWPNFVMAAPPASTNYTLNDYSFGSGGSTSDMGSESFDLYSATGELSGMTESESFQARSGLVMGMQSEVPTAPSLDNPHNYYDRLLVTLDSSSDKDGVAYAFAISRDDFATTQYISTAGTPKNQLEANDFQSYDDWGGADGMLVNNLESNSDYKIKAKAMEGDYTESEFSEEVEASTVIPSLTFTVNGNANMGVWNEDNNFSSTAVSTLTTSTNAYNGYSVYAFATSPLTRQNGSETINNYTGTYASPGSWLSGMGFGYTTNDTSVAGSPKWNPTTCPADGGPPLCYAAFSHSAPGNIVVDHADALEDGVISNEEFELTYKAVTQASQTAGTYTTNIIYTIVPSY